jgi:K(+)-stimulated pyrophosphate-energized sodium pump
MEFVRIEMLVPLLGFLGLGVAYAIYASIMRQPAGEGRVVEISDEIHKGAMVFMSREFRMLGIFAMVIAVALVFKDPYEAMAFVMGAVASGFAGYIGMSTATRANVRTTVAAHTRGPAEALSDSLLRRLDHGTAVASLGLLGLGTGSFSSSADPRPPHHSRLRDGRVERGAVLARRGRHLHQGADVGADLVGKVEAGIPEDDPRNPGVIADNVGDNVGDVAGMGSDIFESYCGAMIATIAIASTLAIDQVAARRRAHRRSCSCPSRSSVGLVCSIAGIFAVKAMSTLPPASALRWGRSEQRDSSSPWRSPSRPTSDSSGRSGSRCSSARRAAS